MIGMSSGRAGALLRRHEWPAEKELKWRGITTKAVPQATAVDAYDTLASLPITCFVVALRPRHGQLVAPEWSRIR